jgi:predicted alpha/beta-fold hydrolase
VERGGGAQQPSRVHAGPGALKHGRFGLSAGFSDFAPPFWLRSPHFQSIIPSFPLSRSQVERRAAPLIEASREVILDCGEGVRLQGFHAARQAAGRPASSRLVVLLHGWEGSADSLYILRLGQILFARGFDIFRLNLRDHGATHHLNRDLFHSCRLPEVVGATREVQRLFPGELSLVGFSLGGNFALRVGARARTAGIDLHRIVAISPVLEPEITLDALESGFSLYHRYFVWKWVRSLRKKTLAWPGHYDFADLLRTPTLRSMTDGLVRRYTDFPDMVTYLRGYSIVRGALDTLEVPSRIIAAQDDPMIPASDLARLPRTGALSITHTRFGGHCGFVDRLGGESWIVQRVTEELG